MTVCGEGTAWPPPRQGGIESTGHVECLVGSSASGRARDRSDGERGRSGGPRSDPAGRRAAEDIGLGGVQSRRLTGGLDTLATLLLALLAATAGELEVDHRKDLFIGQPAVVPQDREGVACAAEPVATRRAGRSALVRDHAPGPASAHDGGACQVLAELDEAVVT